MLRFVKRQPGRGLIRLGLALLAVFLAGKPAEAFFSVPPQWQPTPVPTKPTGNPETPPPPPPPTVPPPTNPGGSQQRAPEPASLVTALIGAGLAGIYGLSRRRAGEAQSE